MDTTSPRTCMFVYVQWWATSSDDGAASPLLNSKFHGVNPPSSPSHQSNPPILPPFSSPLLFTCDGAVSAWYSVAAMDSPPTPTPEMKRPANSAVVS